MRLRPFPSLQPILKRLIRDPPPVAMFKRSQVTSLDGMRDTSA